MSNDKDKKDNKNKNKKTEDNIGFLVLKWIFFALFIMFFLNILGNWLDQRFYLFDFELFNISAPVIAAILAVFVGYKQYLDQKTTEQQKIRDEQITENSKRLYELDMKELEREKEIFYEFFSSIIKLTQSTTVRSVTPMDFYTEINNQFIESFDKADKLDFLTNFSLYLNSENCLECDVAAAEGLSELTKIKNIILRLRSQITGEIRKELDDLRQFIISTHNVSEDFELKLCDKNQEVLKSITKIINTRIKNELYMAYKSYYSLQKQCIENKREINYKLNEKCKDCKHSKFTYQDVEANLLKSQRISCLTNIVETMNAGLEDIKQTTSNTNQQTTSNQPN